jgi:hypothetical protein
MRNISFSMTTEQYRSGQKSVTRRLGWWDLKVGDILMGVEKSQGIPKGGKIVKIHPLMVIGVRKEPLLHIMFAPKNETTREGFPGLLPGDFIKMFVEHNQQKCRARGSSTPVNRIEFRHLAICEKCGEVCAWESKTCLKCSEKVLGYFNGGPCLIKRLRFIGSVETALERVRRK